jgi:LmbE family N-acetylglucosaminyl deacetylase
VKVLAVGAHPDDVELGCGATLLAHRARGDEVALLVLTDGAIGPQSRDSRIEEQREAAAILGASLHWGGFRDGMVPTGRACVDVVEAVLRDVGADVVYTHVPRDTHQDHRAAGESTLAASRGVSRVLLYETPSTRGFAPSLFTDATPHLEGKLAAVGAHMSQVLLNPRVDLEAVEAQARYRGLQARLRHAEGFETDRFTWDLGSGAHPVPAQRGESAERGTQHGIVGPAQRGTESVQRSAGPAERRGELAERFG